MAASEVLTIRLPAGRGEALRRVARRLGRSRSELSAMFIDERLRESEFAHIEFRDSAVGRQGYIRGTRLAVWMAINLWRSYRKDFTKTAAHLEWPVERVRAAVNYALAYPQEIEDAIEDHRSFDAERLSRLLPGLEVVEASRQVPSPKRVR